MTGPWPGASWGAPAAAGQETAAHAAAGRGTAARGTAEPRRAGPVRVRVPATSANLGPGFDALGLALSQYDVVEARAGGRGLSIEVTGEGAATADAGERHLVVRAMRETFGLLGGQPPGLALRCANTIPHGRGLGSSAAAIVAGILAARALAGEAGADLPDGAVFRLATEMEGHPDNVAACLGGGLTIAWAGPAGPRMTRLDPLPAVVPVVLVAPAPLATETARGALPASVPHADAAASAGRSALLVAALTSDPGALLAATEDWLHQPYRAGMMPATAGLVRRLREAGIPAVVSGAGPSVLAFLLRPGGPAGPGGSPLPAETRDLADLDMLGSTAREMGTEWGISVLDVDRHGASIHSAEPGASPDGSTPQ